jgi:hypothetical protein
METIAIESHRLVGLEVTIYNPKLDQDGSGARHAGRSDVFDRASFGGAAGKLFGR